MMTNHGDDCYFYYYSTCTKGDSCPFRHCEAAIGNETVCNLWEEGRCYRPVCKFRHMQITHNRKEISCYWENQPAGCQKSHCAFFHEKPRYIDGLYVPPDKGVKKNNEVPQEEPAPPQTVTPTPANPQLRGVIKTESQEPVPSPTHPPVVINPADDDEDEDDQFSEEGEVGGSPRKVPGGPKLDESLNFGVSTLEEIRLRRALKASMKKAMYSFPGGDTSTNGEKENIRSFYRPAGDAVDSMSDGIPLRRSLAERLGRVVDEEHPSAPSQKSSKSVRERLTLPNEQRAPTQSVETSTRSKKPEQIRIKTLEEIKLEKATKPQNPRECSPSEITISKTITTKSSKGVKRAITVKDNTISNVKTFSEILHVKKKRQEENQEHIKHQNENSRDKSQDKPDLAGSQENDCVGEIRVKTLEEIRREKAARLQAQQAQELQKETSDPQESSAKKPRLLRLQKLTSQSKVISQKSENVTEKQLKSAPMPNEAPSPNNSIKVKTFEEIMREKRLRKQDNEEQTSSSCQAKNSADTELPPQQSTGPVLKRKVPAKITFTADSTTSESVVRKARSSPATVTSDTPITLKNNGTEGQSHKPVSSDVASLTKSPTEERQSNVPKTQEPGTGTKVRPKLNVKPSIVKPTVHLRPGQKRKAPERSAVAAVKPLNSTSTESQSESACTDRQVFSSTCQDTLQNADVVCNPVTSSDSGSKSTPMTPGQEPQAPDTSTVSQSRTLKTPNQTKSRRSSVAASRSTLTSDVSTSAVDDFEELISEFTTDDQLEDDVDPDLGEDDLLQELSEMIDS